MTQIIRVPGVSTNPNLPKLYPHKIMSKGSLLLVEPAHPDCQFALTDNAVVPNIAKKTAMAMLGAGTTEAQVSGLFKAGTTGGITNGKYLFEKTSSGAFHGIASQNKTKFTGNLDGGGITFTGSNIAAYMRANVSHNFFIAFKGRVTRPANERDTSLSPLIYPGMFGVCSDSFTNDYFALFATQQSLNGGRSTNIPTPINSHGPNNPTRFDFARYSFSRGVNSGTLSSINRIDVAFARTSLLASTWPSSFTAFPSWILHNIYIEDLTVSGRTEAQVAKIYTDWHDESIAVGGVYYNETYTSPTLIP